MRLIEHAAGLYIIYSIRLENHQMRQHPTRPPTQEGNAHIVKNLNKIIALAVLGGAAIAAPLLSTTAAHAATVCQDVPTTTGPATFHATQPSGGGGNWDHTFTVNVATDGGFTGTNEIRGLDAGQTVTVNETVSGQITDKNYDGVKEVTVVAIRNSGFYTSQWTVTDAPMNGTIDSMTDGTTSYVTAQDWTGGALPITF